MIQDLPGDILFEVLAFVPLSRLIKFAGISKYFLNVINQDALWQQVYHAQQKSLYFSVTPLSSVTCSFKELFKLAKQNFLNFSCPQLSRRRGTRCNSEHETGCFLSRPFSLDDYASITLSFKPLVISQHFIRFGVVEFSEHIKYDESLSVGCGFSGNGYVNDYERNNGKTRDYYMQENDVISIKFYDLQKNSGKYNEDIPMEDLIYPLTMTIFRGNTQLNQEHHSYKIKSTLQKFSFFVLLRDKLSDVLVTRVDLELVKPLAAASSTVSENISQ